MSWYEQLALTIVASILHQAIKNPASVQKEVAILTEIYNDLGTLLAEITPPPVTQTPTVPPTA